MKSQNYIQTWTFQGNCLLKKSAQDLAEAEFFREELEKERQQTALRNGKDLSSLRGKKSKILSFTRRSARTLGTLLSKLNYKNCYFLTLTHSARESHSAQSAKIALDSWSRQMHRAFPKFSAVWRLEKQQNGEPHFHLIIWGVDALEPKPLVKIQALWKTAMQLTRTPRIDVKPITSSTGAYLYLVGHSSKRNQTWAGQEIGRYWGKLYARNLPILSAQEVELTDEQVQVLNRIWERKELKRIKWLKKRYRRDFDARPFDLGDVKLFHRNPLAIMQKYFQIFKKKC